MGVRAKPEHLFSVPDGTDVISVNRGGDVTFHGPGQLVGYPILNVGGKGGLTDTAKYVCRIEQIIIDTLDDLGLPGATRAERQPGVWIGDNKIAAIGVRISRGRTMHGFALNVDTDLSWFNNIVPCGLADKGVTSLQNEGIDVDMKQWSTSCCLNFRTCNAKTFLEARPRTDLSAFSRGEGPGEAIKPEVKEAPVRLIGRLAPAGVDSTDAVR